MEESALDHPCPATDWWTPAIYYKNFLLSVMSPKRRGDRTASLPFDPSPISRLSVVDIHQSLRGVKHGQRLPQFMKSLEIATSRQSPPARNSVDKGLTPEIPSRSHLCRSAETDEGFLISGSPSDWERD